MSKSEALKQFEHEIEGKTSSYSLKTGNDLEAIVSAVRRIIEDIFPTMSLKLS